MRSAMQWLIGRCPDWFRVERDMGGDIVGLAFVPETVWTTSGLRLRLHGGISPAVSEAEPGLKLPVRCPERHIQEDRTFCLGLHGLEVGDVESADQWWEQLRQYLRCQSVAERTGVWPPAHALDHGEAGEYHERALEIAQRLGIEEEYAAAYLDEASWVTDPDLRLLGRFNRPINGRAPCPRGCRTHSRPSRPIVRRKCRDRDLLLELVICERKRRTHLDAYWTAVRAAGTACCQRMKVCPLRTNEKGGE